MELQESSELSLIETNVDDCTPELISYLMERVIADGALDIHVIPCIMKKGRPGYLIRILTDDPERFARVLMEETGTLGVRLLKVDGRFKVKRKTEIADVKFGNKTESVRIKKSEYVSKTEFDDVKRIARQHGIPFREVVENISSGD